jgi:hypothetical protein
LRFSRGWTEARGVKHCIFQFSLFEIHPRLGEVICQNVLFQFSLFEIQGYIPLTEWETFKAFQFSLFEIRFGVDMKKEIIELFQFSLFEIQGMDKRLTSIGKPLSILFI